jgi:hypothetical protein
MWKALFFVSVDFFVLLVPDSLASPLHTSSFLELLVRLGASYLVVVGNDDAH